MKDIIIRGLLADKQVRLMAISGKELVEEARQTHGLSRVCTAALGRALQMTAMMGAQLKSEDEAVTTLIKGGGMAGNIVCTAHMGGIVKGYIENPTLELPPSPNGKLDVALAVGWFGELTVVRDLSMKEPYVGSVPMVSGEIAEDFAQYYSVSEQQGALVYLGVMVDAESGETLSAGGMLLQPMPGCSEEVLDTLTFRAKRIEQLSKMLQSQSLRDALMELFADIGLEIIGNDSPAFRCDCSRERLERVLLSLGETELLDMIEQDHGAQLTCHFCNKVYSFNEVELQALLQEGLQGKSESAQ